MTNVAAGSIVLTGERGELLLVEEEGARGTTHAIPAGTYRLRTTRVEREKDGKHWFVSMSGPTGEPREFPAGATTKLEVDDTIHFRGQARRDGERLRIGFEIRCADGRGLSIYRDDRRVTVGYRVLDKAGKVVAEGTTNYG